MDAVSALVTLPPTPPLASSVTVPEAAAAAINRPTSANSIHHVNQSTNNNIHFGNSTSLGTSTAAAAAASSLSNHCSNSSNLSSCSSSSSNSSGYGSTTTTPTNNYEFQQQQQQTTPTNTPAPTTPIAIAEPIIPVATVAAVTPFYNESIATHNLDQQQQQQQQHTHHLLQQQHQYQLLPQSHLSANSHQHQPQYLPRQQQYHSTYADYQQSPPVHNLSGASSISVPAYNMSLSGPYEISPSSAQYKSSSLTALNYERCLGARSTTYNQQQQQPNEAHNKPVGQNSQQQLPGALSSTKQRSSSLIGSSSNVTTSKPQAAATPFYAQPLSQTHNNPTPPYYDNAKHKIPFEYHNSYGSVSPATAATYHQQQKYYAAAKSQLKEVAYGSPSVGLNSKTLYTNTGNFFPGTASTFDKYLYPPHASSSGYPSSNHIGGEVQQDQGNYRKPSAANSANSSSWPWGIDYATGNSRTIPPPPSANHLPTATVAPTHATYLTPNPSVLARDSPYYMGPEKYGMKYDKYAMPAYQQTYVNPTPSRHHMWSSNAQPNNLAPLNDRHPMATGPSVQTSHGLHSSAYFAGNAAAAAALNNRQACCNQVPYQPQNCYYPPTHSSVPRLPNNQTATVAPPSGYLPANQQPLGQSPHLNALTTSCKYGGVMPDYGNVSKLKNTNDLYLNSNHYDNNPTPHNYGYGSTHGNQSLYATNAHQPMAHGPTLGSVLTHDAIAANPTSYTNDLNLMTSNFDNYYSHLDAHLSSHTLAGIQNPQQQSQQPPPAYAPTSAKRALLDYRKPIQPQPSPTINQECYPSLPISRDHHYNQHDLLNTPETTTSFNEYETQLQNSSYTSSAEEIIGSETETGRVADEGNKNLSLRDFIANWNDDEDEYQNNEELNFDQNTVIQEVLEAAPSAEETVVPIDQHTTVEEKEIVKSSSIIFKADNPAAENFTASALSEADHDGSQYANLPDIIIDIEKSNTINTTISPENTTNQPVITKNNTSLNLNNFDVEKELDELKIKKTIPQESTKDILNDTKVLTNSVNTSQLSPCKNLATQLSFEDLNLDPSNKTVNNPQIINTAQQRSDLPSEHYFKDMEGYESGNSRHSNESAFEKEYETFINKITNKTAPKANDDKCKKEEQQEDEFQQNVQEFSKFYKRKRKLKEDELKSSTSPTPKLDKKKLKTNLGTKINNSNFPQVYTKKSRKRFIQRKQLLPKRTPFSIYYKIIHSLRRGGLSRLKRARIYLTELREKHLPLIKRQSFKNYTHCLTENYFNPPTLKALCILSVNTEEFRQRILLPIDGAVKKESSCLEAEDKQICPDPTCETCEVIRSLMEAECFEAPLAQQATESSDIGEDSQERITVIDEDLNIVDLNLKKDEYIVISTEDENLQYTEDNVRVGKEDMLDVQEILPELEPEEKILSKASKSSTDFETSLELSENEFKSTNTLDFEDKFESGNTPAVSEITATDELKNDEEVKDTFLVKATTEARFQLPVRENPIKETLKDDETKSDFSGSSESDSESDSSSSCSSSSSSSSTTSSDAEESEDEAMGNSHKNSKNIDVACVEDFKKEDGESSSIQNEYPESEDCVIKDILQATAAHIRKSENENFIQKPFDCCSKSASIQEAATDIVEEKLNILSMENSSEIMDENARFASDNGDEKSSFKTLNSENSKFEYESDNSIKNLTKNKTTNTVVTSDDESESINDNQKDEKFEETKEYSLQNHLTEPISIDGNESLNSEEDTNLNERGVDDPNKELTSVFHQSPQEKVSNIAPENFNSLISSISEKASDQKDKMSPDIRESRLFEDTEDSENSLSSVGDEDSVSEIKTTQHLFKSTAASVESFEKRNQIKTTETDENSLDDSKSSIELEDKKLYSTLEEAIPLKKEEQELENSSPKIFLDDSTPDSNYVAETLRTEEISICPKDTNSTEFVELTKEDYLDKEVSTSLKESHIFIENYNEAPENRFFREENTEKTNKMKNIEFESLMELDQEHKAVEKPYAEQQEISSTDGWSENSAQSCSMDNSYSASPNYDLTKSLNDIKDYEKSNAESLPNIDDMKTCSNSSSLANETGSVVLFENALYNNDSEIAKTECTAITTGSDIEKTEHDSQILEPLKKEFVTEEEYVCRLTENISEENIDYCNALAEIKITKSALSRPTECHSLPERKTTDVCSGQPADLVNNNGQNLDLATESSAIEEKDLNTSTEEYDELTTQPNFKISNLINENNSKEITSISKHKVDNFEGMHLNPKFLKENHQSEKITPSNESEVEDITEENICTSEVYIESSTGLLNETFQANFETPILKTVCEKSDFHSLETLELDHKMLANDSIIEKPRADVETLNAGLNCTDANNPIILKVLETKKYCETLESCEDSSNSSITSASHCDSNDPNIESKLETNYLEENVVQNTETTSVDDSVSGELETSHIQESICITKKIEHIAEATNDNEIIAELSTNKIEINSQVIPSQLSLRVHNQAVESIEDIQDHLSIKELKTDPKNNEIQKEIMDNSEKSDEVKETGPASKSNEAISMIIETENIESITESSEVMGISLSQEAPEVELTGNSFENETTTHENVYFPDSSEEKSCEETFSDLNNVTSVELSKQTEMELTGNSFENETTTHENVYFPDLSEEKSCEETSSDLNNVTSVELSKQTEMELTGNSFENETTTHENVYFPDLSEEKSCEETSSDLNNVTSVELSKQTEVELTGNSFENETTTHENVYFPDLSEEKSCEETSSDLNNVTSVELSKQTEVELTGNSFENKTTTHENVYFPDLSEEKSCEETSSDLNNVTSVELSNEALCENSKIWRRNEADAVSKTHFEKLKHQNSPLPAEEEKSSHQTLNKDCEKIPDDGRSRELVPVVTENSEVISNNAKVSCAISKSNEHSNDLLPENPKNAFKLLNNEKESTTEEDVSGDFYGFKNQSSFEDESGDFHGFEDLEEVARIRQEMEQLNEDSTANDGFLNFRPLNKELHKTSTASLSTNSSGSEINELEALEKELSQHLTHISVVEEDDKEIKNETDINDIEHIKQMLESDEEHQQDDGKKEHHSKDKLIEDSKNISKDIIKPVKSIIPKLSDLCRAALNSSLNSNSQTISDTIAKPTVLVERELSVEEALAEMYRQAGVLLSDPEDCDNETTPTANEEAHDVVLINLQEILNSDNNDVYVLQCDMNENVLNVMPTTEEVVANEENQNSIEVDNSNQTERVNTVQFIGILDAHNTEPQIHIISSDSESEVIILSDDDEIDFSYTPFVAQNERVSIPFINDNDNNSNDSLSDISTIHHEEIVPDNLNKFLQEEFYKYLHEKYVQRNISKYYHANRVMKKYRKRFIKTKRH